MGEMSRQEVIARRFGPDFDSPCADPSTMECRLYECQKRNRCKKSFRLRRSRVNYNILLVSRFFVCILW